MKRLGLIVVFAMFVVAKSATAFVPVAAFLAPPVVTTATGIALSTWAAIAAGVGALLYSVGLFDTGGNEFMHVRVNPNAPAEVPSGWTAASNPANDPSPPSSAGSPQVTSCSWFNGSNSGTFGVEPGGATSCMQPLINSWNSTPCVTSGGRNITMSIGAVNTAINDITIHRTDCNTGSDAGDIHASYSEGCPAGYSQSGSTCNLSNPSSVRYPPNNRCGLKISGGVMTYDSRDPDCDNPPAGMLSTDGKTLTVTSGANRVQVKINADSTVTVTQWTPSSSGTTTTINSAKTGDPASPSSSQIKTTSQSTTTATGDDAFAQSPSAQTPQFPDDYARDATVAAGNATLGQINTRLGDIKTQLTTDGNTPSDPTSRGQSDIEGVFFPGTFDSLKGWTMPARAVACPTWSFTIWGHGYTIESHCGLIENQRAVVSTICLLVYALIALFIVLGA
jgi:hypothetical protein